ncbi:MAG TPA: hypothetical protein VFQ68_13140 [Streptosporangiaceae bacterium]|nr:hypothetical protein [Streptosporangiaceae bacterium]
MLVQGAREHGPGAEPVLCDLAAKPASRRPGASRWTTRCLYELAR